jgi:hypothetical protein
MSNTSKSGLLHEQIEVLVRHFGARRVRAVIEKLSADDGQERNDVHRPNVFGRKAVQPTIAQNLELVRRRDPEKHRLLFGFLLRLRDRDVLPESQDIRHFAQLVGLKEISGKSRKDMISPLMRFLIECPTDKLRADLRRADNISEQQRREGYSVLTDKILGQG